MANLGIYGGLKTLGDYMNEEEKRRLLQQQAESELAQRQGELQIQQQKLNAIAEGRSVDGNIPATIQIANEIQKALKAGDIERAKLLQQVHKTFDRGFDPYAGMQSQPQIMQAPMQPQMQQPMTERPMPAMQPAPNQQAAVDDIMGMIDSGVVPPQNRQGFASVPGYDEALARREAMKASATEQAKLQQQLQYKPQVKAAEMRQQLEYEPKIKEATDFATAKGEFAGALPRLESSVKDAERKSSVVRSAFNTIFPLIKESNLGNIGDIAASVRKTGEAATLRAQLDLIKANLGFDELQAMRDNSPNGSAVGQVTERELTFLQSVSGNLTTNQNPDVLKRTLQDVMQMIESRPQRIREAIERDKQRFGVSSGDAMFNRGQQDFEARRKLKQSGFSAQEIDEFLKARGQ